MSILDSAGQNLNVSLFDVSSGNCSSYDSIVFFFFFTQSCGVSLCMCGLLFSNRLKGDLYRFLEFFFCISLQSSTLP